MSDIIILMTINSEVTSDHMNRREFIFAGAKSIGSLFAISSLLGASTPLNQQTTGVEQNQKAEAQPVPQESLTENDHFHILHMEDFWNFYRSVNYVENKYGSNAHGDFVYGIYRICERIAHGEISEDNEELRGVRDGWGISSKLSISEAIKHVNKIYILATDDQLPIIREKLILFANNFPAMALTLPPNLYIVELQAPASSRDFIATKAYNEDYPYNFWFNFFHETTHSTDIYFERIKPFIYKENYLHYLTRYYELADEIFEQAISSQRIDDHNDFWTSTEFGARLSLPEIASKMNATFTRLEQIHFEKTFESEGNSIRYNRLVWQIGQKTKRGEQLSEDETLIMTMALQDILHTLVDSRIEFIDEGNSNQNLNQVIIRAQKDLNDLRIRTFASFPIDPELDPMQQMKSRLNF